MWKTNLTFDEMVDIKKIFKEASGNIDQMETRELKQTLIKLII
jgi:hypothetical protein